MDLYRFPFDIQSCNITLQSSAYSVDELKIDSLTDSEWVTHESKDTFQAQGEWELLNINMINSNYTFFWSDNNQLIYQAKGAEKRSITSVETTSVVSGRGGGVRDLQSPPVNDEQMYTLDILKQILFECQATNQQNQQEKTPLCWTRVARIIDVAFLVLYIFTIVVFLCVLGKVWEVY
ncbi:hypothetical protein Q8A67_000208 [Cirrhinus molitorella]|uniref:Neurotransmitter-gated ion-channel ligand-binding domain-containing protein n=1 Tax=Cirrhinus molitorella TaxID=172907 RepID=A0AA88TYJ7_9TELE|nr:hypothetical protein Q8A67_000208 [Cirrhinus molitorella]